MSKNINNKYWIPLLEWSNTKNKIIWGGKCLPLPLNKKNIQKISKEYISKGFGKEINPNNTFTNKKGLAVEKGLFCTIKNKTYLLGTNNIFKTPNQANNDDTNSIMNIRDLKEGISEQKIQKMIKTLANNNIIEQKYGIQNRGIQIKLSGRLGGVNKSMRYSESYGSFKPQSFDSKLDFYNKPIYTKWGTIGLKIYLGQ